MKKNLSKMPSEMNVIWKKGELQKYSKESLTSAVHASGDCAELHCKLCGASDHLQLITNDRLDETLRLYFGVEVPPDGVICESCVKCMKITEGFSALVHASFDKTDSEDSSRYTVIQTTLSPGVTNMPSVNQKEILSLLRTKLSLEATRKRVKRRITKAKSNVVFKKIIIACTMCGQKYPMFMPDDGVKKFVCSRCHKKATCRDSNKNNTLSSVRKVELRCKLDSKRNGRLNCQPKKPQQINQQQNAMKYDHLARHQCAQCPKKYAVAENLATHVKAVHEGSSSVICSVCGKKIKSKEFLENHMREHATQVKVFQCSECMRIFKSKRALDTHCIYHEKQKLKSFSS